MLPLADASDLAAVLGSGAFLIVVGIIAFVRVMQLRRGASPRAWRSFRVGVFVEREDKEDPPGGTDETCG